MVLIIRWKITRPWDNNYLEYIIEIYLFFFFFFFSILFLYITQLHFNKLKFPPKKLFTIWKTDNQAERFSSMTIIAKFASVCTRSCKLKYLTLCVLVDCTVRLSEKGIVIVPFSFSLLIFFFFFHSIVLLFPLIIKYIASYCVAKIRTKVGCFSYYHEQTPIRSRLFVTITRIRSRYVLSRTIN